MNKLLREKMEALASDYGMHCLGRNISNSESYKQGAEAMLKAVIEVIGEFDEISATLTSRLPDCTNAEHTKQRCFINGAEWKHAEILRRLRDE